jgi:hypothetical protein
MVSRGWAGLNGMARGSLEEKKIAYVYVNVNTNTGDLENS